MFRMEARRMNERREATIATSLQGLAGLPGLPASRLPSDDRRRFDRWAAKRTPPTSESTCWHVRSRMSRFAPAAAASVGRL